MHRLMRATLTLCGLTSVALPGGVMARALDSWLRGHGFDPQPFRFQVTTLGKLLTYMCLCHQAVNFVPVKGR